MKNFIVKRVVRDSNDSMYSITSIFENEINKPPKGYELYEWQSSPETSDAHAYYVIVFKRIPEAKSENATGRKFKKGDNE